VLCLYAASQQVQGLLRECCGKNVAGELKTLHEVQALRDKSNEMEIKMDRETNALKAAVEQSKNEVLRYSLSMILALMAAGLTAARVLQK
jgi:hypothetical protein